MTGNQLVAYNLRLAREGRHWTQEQAAVELWPYLGERWSKATFSVAERSVNPSARKREFDANELLAFSRVFEKPISWFFTPPKDEQGPFRCGDPMQVTRTVGRAELLEAAGSAANRDYVTAAALRSMADALERGQDTKTATEEEENDG